MPKPDRERPTILALPKKTRCAKQLHAAIKKRNFPRRIGVHPPIDCLWAGSFLQFHRVGPFYRSIRTNLHPFCMVQVPGSNKLKPKWLNVVPTPSKMSRKKDLSSFSGSMRRKPSVELVRTSKLRPVMGVCMTFHQTWLLRPIKKEILWYSVSSLASLVRVVRSWRMWF